MVLWGPWWYIKTRKPMSTISGRGEGSMDSCKELQEVASKTWAVGDIKVYCCSNFGNNAMIMGLYVEEASVIGAISSLQGVKVIRQHEQVVAVELTGSICVQKSWKSYRDEFWLVACSVTVSLQNTCEGAVPLPSTSPRSPTLLKICEPSWVIMDHRKPSWASMG